MTTLPAVSGATSSPASAPIIKLKHPGHTVGSAVVILLGLALLVSAITNKNFQWDVVGQYLFGRVVLTALLRTLWLTAASMAIGIVLGALLAIMRLARSRFLSTAAGIYVWFFRGVPLLVLLVFTFNFSALYPNIPMWTPWGGVSHLDVNSLLTPTIVAISALGLNEAAYMSEIIRAGIKSIDHGQSEAAAALSMTPWLTMRRIVLPQALSFVLPPTMNQLTSMLKNTSLVSAIAFPDLLHTIEVIYSQNFQTIPLLLVAALWYLAVTTVLTALQFLFERRLRRVSRGDAVVAHELGEIGEPA